MRNWDWDLIISILAAALCVVSFMMIGLSAL